MLFNCTHTDKDNIKEINALVGNSISFFKSIKLGGIGSGRMIIEAVSHNFKEILPQVSDVSYGSIEIRPKGIIVFSTKQLDRYCWAIPFYKLTVFNSDFFSIHSDNNFIRFRKDKKYHENKKFIKKMVDLKNVATQNHFL